MLKKLRNKIALSLIDKKTGTLTSPELYEFLRSGGYSIGFMPGQPVYTELTLARALREGYKMAVPVYRAVRAIVQACSGIPWVVLDEDGEEIPDHAFTKAWANPNPFFSGQDNMEFIIAHLLLVGNSLIQPVPVKGEPREFWIAMPDQIQPIPSKDKSKWLEGWQYTDEVGHQTELPPEQFIHFMQFDPGNPYWGVGCLQAAGRAVDVFNEALDTQKVSMQNRGMPSGILTPEEPMSQQQFEEARRVMKEIYLDKSSRREPWIMSRKVNWLETSMTPVEMDYIKSQIQNVRDVASAFGLDPWWLGDREHSSYNNVLEARRSLYEDSAMPMLTDIQSTLNLKLAPLYGEGITIVYDTSNIPALREDFGKKVEQAKTLWSMAVPFEQINDKLGMGFEEFPGWEKGYLPFSVAPVGSEGSLPLKESTPKAEGEKTIWNEEQKAIHWKKFDTWRQAYCNLLQKKFQPLYEKTGQAVAKAMTGLPAQLKYKASKAIEKQTPEWEKLLTATLFTLIEDFGRQVEEQAKTLPEIKQFDPFSRSIRRWVSQHAAESVKTILDTQREAMHNLIVKGIEDELSSSQLAKSVRDFYEHNARYLAMRVARTETAIASGYGQHEAALELGMDTKRWISSRDERVRDSHRDLDGESHPIKEPYSNGQMYVGDSSGDPGEFINCRCAEQFFREG